MNKPEMPEMKKLHEACNGSPEVWEFLRWLRDEDIITYPSRVELMVRYFKLDLKKIVEEEEAHEAYCQENPEAAKGCWNEEH